MNTDEFISDLSALLAEADGVPAKVKQYAREIEKNQDGKDGRRKYTPGKAYATAWSRFCKYHDPGNKHCQMKRSQYFSGK